VPVLALAVLAQFSNRDHALNLERVFSDYRGPLIAIAVGGFIIGVIGHLFQSKAAIVTGILLVFLALVAFPVVLYVRGGP
jgi:predicted lipid-binding transport protein (Tim44 family)